MRRRVSLFVRPSARRHGESGLALMDVLLGMAIFALVAVIAVQAFGIFKQRAYVTQAVSDAHQVGMAIAAAMTDPNFIPGPGMADSPTIPTGTITDDQLGALGANRTAENRIVIQVDPGVGYNVCVDNQYAYAWYEQEPGTVTRSGKLSESEPGCEDFVSGDPVCIDPSETPIWIDPEPAYMEDYNPTVSYDSSDFALPWDAGITQDYWAANGHSWWQGDGHTYTLDPYSSSGAWVLRDGVQFGNDWNGDPVQVGRLDNHWVFPWDEYDEAEYQALVGDRFYWNDDGATYTADFEGYVYRNGDLLTLQVEVPAEDGHWYCDSGVG